MLGLARIGRFVSRAGAVIFLAAIITWVLPLFPGVTCNSSYFVNVLVAGTYLIFEMLMYRGVAALPKLVTSVLLGFVIFAGAARESSYAGIREGLKKAAANRLIPYSFLLVLSILLRMAIGVVFVTIISAWATSLISSTNLPSIAVGGVVIALSSCFWPLLLVTVLALIYTLAFLPVLLVIAGLGKIHAFDKLLSEEKQKNLGYSLGQGMAFGVMLLAWGFVFFQSNFPVNWEKLPPQKVPDGLSTQQYYDLGIQYKHMGWTEQARDALNKAIAQGPSDDYSDKAKRYLQTKLPRQPVAREAEQRNIQGFNQMFGGDIKAAKQTFEELIAEYPNFEWPYSNLASIYLQEKRPQQAKELLDKALAINPYYVNAWRHLGEVHKLLGNLELATQCTSKIAELDVDDEMSRLTKK
jgi:Tfp pilus assembly protein PilF